MSATSNEPSDSVRRESREAITSELWGRAARERSETEYVGPARFQWLDKTQDLMNEILDLLPEEYKVNPRNGQLKERIDRAAPEEVARVDPSEAIRSDEIPELLQSRFDVLYHADFGGTINQFLLADIAANLPRGRRQRCGAAQSNLVPRGSAHNRTSAAERLRVLRPQTAVGLFAAGGGATPACANASTSVERKRSRPKRSRTMASRSP
jgi:hypothetical protein